MVHMNEITSAWQKSDMKPFDWPKWRKCLVLSWLVLS